MAYIRGLAELRGRNADWAERAVREAVSLTATEAQAQRVIDLVAPDLDALLARLHGFTVRDGDAERTLALTDYRLVELEPRFYRGNPLPSRLPSGRSVVELWWSWRDSNPLPLQCH